MLAYLFDLARKRLGVNTLVPTLDRYVSAFGERAQLYRDQLYVANHNRREVLISPDLIFWTVSGGYVYCLSRQNRLHIIQLSELTVVYEIEHFPYRILEILCHADGLLYFSDKLTRTRRFNLRAPEIKFSSLKYLPLGPLKRLTWEAHTVTIYLTHLLVESYGVLTQLNWLVVLDLSSVYFRPSDGALCSPDSTTYWLYTAGNWECHF